MLFSSNIFLFLFFPCVLFMYYVPLKKSRTGQNLLLTFIKNNKNSNGKKVLLVRDSFGCVFSPFLALACGELQVMDLRKYNELSLSEYVKREKPDIVMFLYYRGTTDELFPIIE